MKLMNSGEDLSSNLMTKMGNSLENLKKKGHNTHLFCLLSGDQRVHVVL